MKKTTLPVALIQERNHGEPDANLAVIEARVAEAAKRGARAGAAAGTAQRSVLLPARIGGRVRPGRNHSRPEHRAPGPAGQAARRGAGQLAVREARDRPVPQHRGGVRRRRLDRRQVPQDAHPGRSGLLREVLLHPGRPRLRADRYLGRPPRRDGVLGPVVSGRRAPDGAGRRRTAAVSRPRSAGIRTTSRPRRIASAMPGSSATAAMPSPTACRC